MMSEWISVEDRLPELPCLVYWTDGCCEAYNAGDDVLVDPDNWADMEEVQLTHWMPLPEPPAEQRGINDIPRAKR